MCSVGVVSVVTMWDLLEIEAKLISSSAGSSGRGGSDLGWMVRIRLWEKKISRNEFNLLFLSWSLVLALEEKCIRGYDYKFFLANPVIPVEPNSMKWLNVDARYKSELAISYASDLWLTQTYCLSDLPSL